ncbi:3-keto-L-gulonate-6-phosphate decarboxylase sgbH [Mannheimia haemolytica]|nr:3-keto-L-gulonate-6-phosphate decarboxylase sgbH [Mannheimia haemolytica]
MSKPLLQIALDSLSLEKAVADAKQAENQVEIIECGTILAFSEGMKAVSTLRALHPNHIIVCDLKTTDGGAILAKMAFEAGADWLTVSAAAHPATKAACKKVADEFNAAHPELKVKKEIQIEIYGNWTVEKDAKEWVELGVKQAIYHRSRDAELAGKGWTAEDVELMKQLSDLGIELSITGGIVPEDIHLFKEIKNAKAFIAGRALVGEKGKQTAEAIRAEIDKYCTKPALEPNKNGVLSTGTPFSSHFFYLFSIFGKPIFSTISPHFRRLKSGSLCLILTPLLNC